MAYCKVLLVLVLVLVDTFNTVHGTASINKICSWWSPDILKLTSC